MTRLDYSHSKIYQTIFDIITFNFFRNLNPPYKRGIKEVVRNYNIVYIFSLFDIRYSNYFHIVNIA
jgi:hypothetical protein